MKTHVAQLFTASARSGIGIGAILAHVMTNEVTEQANEAYLSGQSVADCPYPVGSSSRTEWLGAFIINHFEQECQ